MGSLGHSTRRYYESLPGDKWDGKYRYHVVAAVYLEVWLQVFKIAARRLGQREQHRDSGGNLYASQYHRQWATCFSAAKPLRGPPFDGFAVDAPRRRTRTDDQGSLPTEWWVSNIPVGSYRFLTASNRG